MAIFTLADNVLNVVDYSAGTEFRSSFASGYDANTDTLTGVLGQSPGTGGALDQANLHALVDATSKNTTGPPPLLRMRLTELPTISSPINAAISLAFFRGTDGIRQAGESGVDLTGLKVSITQTANGRIVIAALDQSTAATSTTTGNKVPAAVHYSDPLKNDLSIKVPFYTTDRLAEAYELDGVFVLDFYFFNFLTKLSGLSLETKLTEGDYRFLIDPQDGFELQTAALQPIGVISLGLPIDATPTRSNAADSGFVNDAPVGSVTITGTVKQGETLTATHNLTDADGIPNTANAITWQWQAGGVNIVNATASAYALTQDEVDKTISVKASYTDNGGTPETVKSAETRTVEAITPPLVATSAQVSFWKDSRAISDAALDATTQRTDASGAVTLTPPVQGVLTLTPTKSVSPTDKAEVGLLDAIAVLKSIVGLTTLNAHQKIAADFDKKDGVGLLDAIGILKHVVGLPSSTPEWVFVDKVAAKPDPTAPITVNVIADTTVQLTGILRGDVDGSWAV